MPDTPTAASPMDRVLVLCAAAGRADGIAARATVPFNPALRNLRYRLLLWAACTRDPLLREWLPEFRDKARNAVACYRALQPRDGRLVKIAADAVTLAERDAA